MLFTLVALLAATAIAVPLTRRAGFGSVLGYLLAGIAIGPHGLHLVTDVEEIGSIASLGVVMLLFLIGLELRPHRLWVMRRAVFGLGSAQVAFTAAALASLAHLAGLGWAGAIVLGAGLAMSSTAIVLPMLAERELLTSRAGRDGFAVLLFQDLAFIPMVALVPLLAGTAVPNHVPWWDVLRGAAAIAVILVGGRFLLRPLFRAIGGAKTPEVFTAVSLLIVVGAATLATLGGLSPSLGAFMAGVLLSESEYRHELEADIAPFEGLLLGFFFISVGMSADLSLALIHPVALTVGTAALLAVKAVVAFGLRADQPAGHCQRAALRPGTAAGERVQLRAVRRRHRGGRAGTRRGGDGNAGRRGIDAGHTDTVRRVGALADPAPEACRRAGLRHDRCRSGAGHHLRFWPRRADRRPHPAHARHRLHRAGT